MTDVPAPKYSLADRVVAWVATAIVIVLGACMLMGAARAHDYAHPELDGWYGSLKRPGVQPPSFTSCCSKTDCHTTEAGMRQGHWWARIGIRRADDTWDLRDWVEVPDHVVLQKQDNPTGEAVICHNTAWGMDSNALDPKGVTIFCFVPPSES